MVVKHLASVSDLGIVRRDMSEAKGKDHCLRFRG